MVKGLGFGFLLQLYSTPKIFRPYKGHNIRARDRGFGAFVPGLKGEKKNRGREWKRESTFWAGVYSLTLIRLQRGEAAPANPNGKRMCSERVKKKTMQRKESPPKEGSSVDKVRQSPVCVCMRACMRACVHLCAFYLCIWHSRLWNIYSVWKKTQIQIQIIKV